MGKIISGKKCHHLNGDGEDIENQGSRFRLSHLPIHLFLRHNHPFSKPKHFAKVDLPDQAA